MELKVLGSGSLGNCYLLKTENEALVIEAGIHFKEVQKSIDFNPGIVKGCLISHEHGDHSKYAVDFINHGIDLYASKGTFDALQLSHHRLNPINKNEKYSIGGFDIIPFKTNHDCNDPLGFLIRHDDLGTLLFATDTYFLNNKFPGVNHILIECNYSEEILKHNVAEGILDHSREVRIKRSHFGLKNVKEFLKVNDLSKTYNIVLLHLSESNSHAINFIKEIYNITGISTFVADEYLELNLIEGPF